MTHKTTHTSHHLNGNNSELAWKSRGSVYCCYVGQPLSEFQNTPVIRSRSHFHPLRLTVRGTELVLDFGGERTPSPTTHTAFPEVGPQATGETRASSCARKNVDHLKFINCYSKLLWSSGLYNDPYTIDYYL